jgi:hypothetical protein
MAQDSVTNKILSQVQDIGKAGINALFPNDFEYYAITLELTDSQGKTIDFLTFPVAPENIDYNAPSAVNIKKNLGGVTALDTSSFDPSRYTLSGTFGRKLRLLFTKGSSQHSTSKGVFGTIQESGLTIKTSILDAKIKSGYGTTKLLESIVEKSKSLDDYNKPVRLYLYNPALNHNFLVKANNLTLHQDIQTSNAMWKYTLEMTAIAPVDKLSNSAPTSMIGTTTMASLNKGANSLVNSLKKSNF